MTISPPKHSFSLESMEEVNFEELVEHQYHLDAETTIEEAYHQFQNHRHSFVGVVSDSRVVGLLSRSEITALVSGRYGFSLYRRKPVREYLIEEPLIIERGTAFSEVIRRVFDSDTEPSLHLDAILMDKDHRFLGIIPAKILVSLQWKLTLRHNEQVEAQRAELDRRNHELFESIEDLRRSQGQFRFLFDNDFLGVILLDEWGEVDAVNSAFASLGGFQNEAPESERGRIPFFEWISLDQRETFREAVMDLNRPGGQRRSIEMELVVEFPGSGSRLLRCFASRIQETAQTAILVEDLTERRSLERRMSRQEKSMLLDSLVGGIAHELNNKLTPIIGFSNLLVDANDRLTKDEMTEMLVILRDAAREAAEIIGQLLQLSKPPAAELIVVDLNQIVRETVDFLRFEAREADCAIRAMVGTTPVPVKVDPAQIKQVLINLAINAIHASENAEVREILLSVESTGSRALVSVVDQGHGIPPEIRARIFEAFFTTKGIKKGSGLGLSVCQSIIKYHRGSIRVESEVGKGTTMCIELPHADAPAAIDRAETRPCCPGHPEFECGSARVLIVDDERYLTSLIQKSLEKEMGLQATVAGNGADAIARLHEADFDLLISDVRMPFVDGFELFEWIRSNRPDMAGRFLFMTGDAGGHHLNDRLNALQVPVLRKPFSIGTLFDHCVELLA